jgi:hypothetical protein
MSDEGLIAELDRIAERSELDALCYLEELTRRELARQTRILLGGNFSRPWLPVGTIPLITSPSA